MRVLLISENRCRDNVVPWPIGVAYVASAVRARGHDVAGLDLMFSGEAAADVRAAVRSFEPDCVGVSIRNIDNQDMHSNEFFLPAAKDVVDVLKSETDAPVVLGGAGFTIFPLECLEYFDLETGVVGEGEESFVNYLDALESGADATGVPGLAVRANGVARVNPAAAPVDYATTPPPDRDAFDVSRYDWKPGQGPPFATNLQSRRGCHLRCIYCSSPTVEGHTLRFRDPASVADEMEVLEKERGLSTVIFVDSNFNYPADYARELCLRIARKRLSIRWSCTANPHWFDDSLFPLMREAGCFAISLGNESGSQTTLESLRKDFTKGDIRRTARAIRERGMQIYCFLLFGGPGETRETVEESVALMDELEPEAVVVTVGIRIFPGCELQSIAEEAGVISKGQNLLRPVFYLEPEVEPWLYEWTKEACASRKGWSL